MRFISLFSGCGGLDLGFVEQGFQCAGAFDIDPITLQTHRKNIGGPTTEFDLSSGVLPAPLTGIDVVLAGSPCQGFSTLGKRAVDDPRNDLVLAASRIGLTLAPKIFLLENVPGLLSGEHKKYLDAAMALWSAEGYTISVSRVSSETEGVGQRRTRLIIVAAKGGSVTIPGGVAARRSLRDALQGVQTAADHQPRLLGSDSIAGRIAAKISRGQKLSNVRAGPRSVHTWQIPEVFGSVQTPEVEVLNSILVLRRRNRRRDYGDADPISMSDLNSFVGADVRQIVKNLKKKNYVKKVGKLLDLTHTFNGKYRRLLWDDPSPTVDTKFGEARYFLHPEENRGFTVREAARVQGFPDTFEFFGSDIQKFRMIGNAVPPPMASAIAATIRRAIES